MQASSARVSQTRTTASRMLKGTAPTHSVKTRPQAATPAAEPTFSPSQEQFSRPKGKPPAFGQPLGGSGLGFGGGGKQTTTLPPQGALSCTSGLSPQNFKHTGRSLSVGQLITCGGLHGGGSGVCGVGLYGGL